MNPFHASPSGLTKLISATTAGAVLTQVCTGGEQGVLLVNNSSGAVFVAMGSSSVVAAVPSTAVPATGICINANTNRAFWMPGGPNMGYIDAIGNVTGVTVKLYATPGFGGI